MLSPTLRTGEKWCRFQQSKFGADREAAPIWVEELKGASLGAGAHVHPSHWCALMDAGCFVCVASVPAPNSPDWVHVMTKALGKETKNREITAAW